MRKHVFVTLLVTLLLAGAAAVSAEAKGPPGGGAARAGAICLSQGGAFFADEIFFVGPGPGFFCEFQSSGATVVDPSLLDQPSLRGVAARCEAAGGQYSTFVRTLGDVVDYFVWGCDLR